MDATTMALLAGSAALGAVVAGVAAFAWFGAQRYEIIKKTVVKTQDLNRSKSDVRIEEIYQTIQVQAAAANALAVQPNVDVSSAYIDLTAAIKQKLDGLYDLSEGVFQMVLPVRNSILEAPKLTAPKYPMPAGGETVTWFPNSPENQPAEVSRPSVNEKMRACLQAFYVFWSQRDLRIREMERSREALDLPLTSDDEFVDEVVRAVG